MSTSGVDSGGVTGRWRSGCADGGARRGPGPGVPDDVLVRRHQEVILPAVGSTVFEEVGWTSRRPQPRRGCRKPSRNSSQSCAPSRPRAGSRSHRRRATLPLDPLVGACRALVGRRRGGWARLGVTCVMAGTLHFRSFASAGTRAGCSARIFPPDGGHPVPGGRTRSGAARRRDSVTGGDGSMTEGSDRAAPADPPARTAPRPLPTAVRGVMVRAAIDASGGTRGSS